LVVLLNKDEKRYNDLYLENLTEVQDIYILSIIYGNIKRYEQILKRK